MKLIIKRLFDIFFSGVLFFLLFWVLFLVWLLAMVDTRTNGIFIQDRIGQYGKRFKIYKFRTMQVSQNPGDFKISRIGRLLRNYKLDELPQLINVLKGEMSIVGPRPDVAGYYDLLENENRKIIELKPGLTSLASLKYYNEEVVLKQQVNPLDYNDKVIFPDKIRMNLEYYQHHTFYGDLKIITATFKFIIKQVVK